MLVPAVFAMAALLGVETSRFDKGLSLYNSGRCTEALSEWTASEKAGEGAPERPLYQGICLARAGEWNRAAEHLGFYTTSHAGDARGWYWLAQAELYQRDFPEARTAINRSIAIDSKSGAAYRTLGEIELELKNHDAAYRAWLKANELNPKDARPPYYIGRLFFEADFLNEAAGWFRETLKREPNHFAAMTYLAMCGERLNLRDTAIDLYRAAIRESKLQNKPYPWAFLNLAKLLRQLGRDREAFATLEEAEKICPEAHVLTVLGQMLAGANQAARAEAVLRQAVAMDPSVPDAHYRLALLLRTKGETGEAKGEMEAFHKAKEAEERDHSGIQAIRKNE